jgi:glycosyltransferase involved in cell wall biosynthesis
MVRFEREQCRRFDQVVAVSESDAETFRTAYGAAHVAAVPTGVDIEYFAPMPLPPEPGHLVFVGAMDWLPNVDGITWFVREVLPLVQQAVPGAHLSIVGRNPGTAIRRLAEAHEGVAVTGAVPDVRPYLARGAAVIVPLRVGGGTRLKIYEAMAAGRPLVSTAVGAEGLPIAPGEHYLAADSAPDLAAACIQLLRDPAAAEAMGRRGAQYVREHFGWAEVAEEFGRICDRVANPRRPGAAVPA